MSPRTGKAMRAPLLVEDWLRPRSGALVVLGTCAAGLVSFSGSGLEADGGSGVGEPAPGAVVTGAAALSKGSVVSPGRATGINRNWPSRTAKSGPSPFHSVKLRTDTS